MRLQDELAGTENRIAVERKRYNDTLQDYNTYIQLFPKTSSPDGQDLNPTTRILPPAKVRVRFRK